MSNPRSNARIAAISLLTAALAAAPPAQAFTGFSWWASTDNFTDARTQRDAAQAGVYDHNWAYLPSQLDTSRGGPTLLLFFAGSGAELDGYTNFMEEAANQGYVVVGLAYRNRHSHTALCGCMANCMGFLEQQSVTGAPNGFYADETAAGRGPNENSVAYRLEHFLGYLQDNNLDGGHFDWRQFLAFDASGNYQGPRWPRIVVAGHSGGGNLAAWILKNRAVVGALTFSSPNPDLEVAQPTDLTITPWAVGGSHGTCSPQSTSDLPDWITNGFGANSAYLMVYDDAHDGAYTTTWNGHNIPAVVRAIGGLSELLFLDGGTPSGRWITRTNTFVHTACGTNNPYHTEVIGNCAGLDASGRPYHHGVWDYMLRTALTF